MLDRLEVEPIDSTGRTEAEDQRDDGDHSERGEQLVADTWFSLIGLLIRHGRSFSAFR